MSLAPLACGRAHSAPTVPLVADAGTGGLRALAAERAALGRVAALAERGAAPAEIFEAVIGEICRSLPSDAGTLGRYEHGDTLATIASWRRSGTGVDPFATTWAPGERARPRGRLSSVAAPVIIDGRLWGRVAVASTMGRALPSDAAERLVALTRLLTPALAGAQGREDLARLAEGQAALARVATLVARGVPSDQLFGAVAQEVGTLLDADLAVAIRYVDSDTATAVATWAADGDRPEVRGPWPLEDEGVANTILRTGRPAREDRWSDVVRPISEVVRDRLGVASSVGSPILVDGRVWGALIVHSRHSRALPRTTECRLGSFTELLTTAVSNFETRSRLAASRARVIAAADAERRRVVRDLHDGAQQRLVHTVVTLKLARHALDTGGAAVPRLLSEALTHAEQATNELRELAHGILPEVLIKGGLEAAVESLATRVPVPVAIDVSVDRLPAAIEATAYFVVAEALTNVAKHARGQNAAVSARVEDDTLVVDVRDDGAGGARPDGTGLMGLRDRLAAVDGRLSVESPPGGGTLVAAGIPLT